MGSTVMATPEFDGGKDFKKLYTEYMKMVFQVIENRMEQTGLEVLKNARLKAPPYSFNDDTGNLRSSIGFILSWNGDIKHTDFKQSDKGSDKQSGIRDGMEYAKLISREYPTGFVITIVAGMEYASFVEALGYDVLTGSTLGIDKKFQAELSLDLQNIDFNNFKLK